MMFYILGWLVFGLIVGVVAKALHAGNENMNIYETILLGVIGSFIGGGINYLFGWSHYLFGSSGFIMSVLGAILLCIALSYFKQK